MENVGPVSRVCGPRACGKYRVWKTWSLHWWKIQVVENRGSGWKTHVLVENRGPEENILGGKHGVWWKMQGLHVIMLFSHMTCTKFTIIQRGESFCKKKEMKLSYI